MTEEIKSAFEYKSPYTYERALASVILAGPENIVSEIGGERFYGWRVLRLGVREAERDRGESRSIYANPFDDTQDIAIARAVYWDAKAVRKSMAERVENYKLSIAARFALIDVKQLEGWLEELSGVHVSVREPFIEDLSTPIRQLRIEQEYVSSVFERVWQGRLDVNLALNERWDRIWRQATEALHSAPRLISLTEHYGTAGIQPVYDLSTYQEDQGFI